MAEVLTSRMTTRGDQVDPPRTGDMLQGFYNHLIEQHLLGGDASARFNVADALRSGKPLQKLWQLTEMSANEFADEVAAILCLAADGSCRSDVSPVACRQLLAAVSARIVAFSHARARADSSSLVVADPTDSAAIRAAEIVLGSAAGDRDCLI